MATKILFVITKSNWGGAQRYVFDMATTLPKDTFEVAVALGGTGEKNAHRGVLDEKLRNEGIRTIFVQSFMRDVALLQEVKTLRELVQLFRTEKPTVVHLNSTKAGGLGALAARLAGVPRIIFTSHGLAWDEDRSMLARAAIWGASWVTFLLCTDVIVMSKDNEKRARSLPFCARKIHLIYNGIALLTFKNREDARFQLSTSMRPPSDTVWLGAIGELTRNKGYEYLLGAVGLLKRSSKNFVLYIIGAGEEELALHKMIAEEGLEDRVHLVGFVSQGWQLLKAFDVFVLTSVKEGLPYVLLEAAQAEVASVGSSIPGVRDIIKDEVTGLIFKSKNPSDLAKKLERLIDNKELRQRLANTAHERAQEEFSIAHMVEKTSALYSTPL
jgi:glycosyltransferase involved in cell wall biosynthesis